MSELNLSESVIMPREDFIELSTVAFDNHHVPSMGERLAGTTQTTLVFMGMAAAITAGSYGWAKALDWRDDRSERRRQIRARFNIEHDISN